MLMLGKLLDGRYEILQVLGAGGFGETYLAVDTRRPGNPHCVVKHLKTMSRESNFLTTARRLFNSEAETLEQLGYHTQIPRLLAYFEEDKEFYLVQDYIQGHTLNQELKTGIPWQGHQVVSLLQEVLPILKFVHNQGVIHRDIKPDNIMRGDENNKLYLLDFGAVKQINVDALQASTADNYTVAIGTPGYMATEQARGLPRPSSDLYSLGVIAIQALSGVKPSEFDYDDDSGEIIWKSRVGISPELDNIINKMVKDHFRDRYMSASQVLEDLNQLPPLPNSNQFPYAANASSDEPTSFEDSPGLPTQLQTEAPNPYFTPVSQRKTLAVGSPPSASTQPVAPNRLQNSSRTSKSSLLRLAAFLGVIFSLSAGLTFALRNTLNSLSNQSGSNGAIVQTDGEICTVKASGLNVRNRAEGKIINSVSKGASVTLSGKQRQEWVEINQPVEGWVSQQYLACEVANQPPEEIIPTPRETVEDVEEDNSKTNTETSPTQGKPWWDRVLSVLGINQEPSNSGEPDSETQEPEKVIASPTPEPSPSPSPSPTNPPRRVTRTAKPQPQPQPQPSTPPRNNSQPSFGEALRKYRAGDVAGAIAIAESIPPNSREYREAQANLRVWRGQQNPPRPRPQPTVSPNKPKPQPKPTPTPTPSPEPIQEPPQPKPTPTPTPSPEPTQEPPQPKPTPTPTPSPEPTQEPPQPKPTPTPTPSPEPTQEPKPPTPEPTQEPEIKNDSESQSEEVSVEKVTKSPGDAPQAVGFDN